VLAAAARLPLEVGRLFPASWAFGVADRRARWNAAEAGQTHSAEEVVALANTAEVPVWEEELEEALTAALAAAEETEMVDDTPAWGAAPITAAIASAVAVARAAIGGDTQAWEPALLVAQKAAWATAAELEMEADTVIAPAPVSPVWRASIWSHWLRNRNGSRVSSHARPTGCSPSLVRQDRSVAAERTSTRPPPSRPTLPPVRDSPADVARGWLARWQAEPIQAAEGSWGFPT